jgi:nitrous oxidase accessory protein NosD
VLDSAASGAVVCLAAGTWKEHVKISKSLVLRGVGPEQTKIKDTATMLVAAAVTISSETVIQVTLENLSVVDGTSYGIEVEGKAKVILKNTQVSSNNTGLRTSGAAQIAILDSRFIDNQVGLSLSGSVQVSLANAQVVRNGRGLQAGETSRVILSRAQISDQREHGIEVTESALVEIRDSSVLSNVACGIEVPSKQARLQGALNLMRGNGTDLCGFAPASIRKALVPQTTRTQLSVPKDFRMLQEAIDAIAPGGVITIAEGTHEAGLTLWKPLTLRGTGRNKTVLKARSDKKLAAGISIIAGANGVRLEEMTLTGGWLGVLAYGNAVLQSLQISGNQNQGVHVRGMAQVEIRESLIRDNRKSSDSPVGIEVTDSAQIKLTQVKISEAWTGLYLLDATRASVASSEFFGNTDGISLEGSAQVSVSHSRVYENKLNGLLSGSASVITLIDSQVFNNGLYGVVITKSAEIRSTTVSHNGSFLSCAQANWVCSGIKVSFGALVRVIDSTIKENADWGLAADLKKCGDHRDSFKGQVVFEGKNLIESNNKSQNQNGMGNPGIHPWNRPGVSDGQVCLP